MKKLNIPLSQIKKFAGQWVAINPVKEQIIAGGKTLKEIEKWVTHSKGEKTTPVGKSSYAFLVPRKDEGPYIL